MYGLVQKLSSSTLRFAGALDVQEFICKRFEASLLCWIREGLLVSTRLVVPELAESQVSPLASPQKAQKEVPADDLDEEGRKKLTNLDLADLVSSYFGMQRLTNTCFLYVNHNNADAIQRIYRTTWRRVLGHTPNGVAIQRALCAFFSGLPSTAHEIGYGLGALGGPIMHNRVVSGMRFNDPANLSSAVFAMMDDVGATFLVTPVCAEFEAHCRRLAAGDVREVLRGISSPSGLAAAVDQIAARMNALTGNCATFFIGSSAEVPSELAKVRVAAAVRSYANGLGECSEEWREALRADDVLALWRRAVSAEVVPDLGEAVSEHSLLTLLSICARSSPVFDVFESVFEQSMTLYFNSHVASPDHCGTPRSSSSHCRSISHLVIDMCELSERFLRDKVCAVEVRRRLSRTYLKSFQKCVNRHEELLVSGLSRELLEILKSSSVTEPLANAKVSQCTERNGHGRVDALATAISLLPSKDVFTFAFASLLSRHLLNSLSDSPGYSVESLAIAEVQCDVLHRIALKVGTSPILPLIQLVREASAPKTCSVYVNHAEKSAKLSLLALHSDAAVLPSEVLESSVSLLTYSRWKPFVVESLVWNAVQLAEFSLLFLPGLSDMTTHLERLLRQGGGAGRRFLWPVCVGLIHVAAHCSVDAAPAFQLRVSPVVAIILAAVWLLDGSSQGNASSLDSLCASLGSCGIPRELVGVVLRQATAAGIVCVRHIAADCDGSPPLVVFSVPPPPARQRKVRLMTPQLSQNDLATASRRHCFSDPSLAEGSGSAFSVDPAMIASRKKKLEAAIARVMKRHKTLAHGKLFDEIVLEMQRQFTVTSGMFKECVGMLLEKEYLARDVNAPDTYTYVS